MFSLRPTDKLVAPRHNTQHRTAPEERNGELPSELILDIFELGASSDKNTALSLLRMTSWSHKKLHPKLYECVALDSWARVDQFKHTIKAQHSDEVQRSVKRLSIALGEYPVADILALCRNITSLVASSTLFRSQSGCNLPPSLVYSPSVVSPHLTHLTIHGPTYHIQPNTLPSSVTHLIFKDDIPISGYSLKAVLSLPKLTHLAFKVTQQPLPYAPDPSPRVVHLLQSLFSQGRPSPDSPVAANSHAGLAPSPITLIAVMLSPNIDTRIVETLASFRHSNVTHHQGQRSHSTGGRPKLIILKEHQCEWWTQAEWASKGGDDVFWKRINKFA